MNKQERPIMIKTVFITAIPALCWLNLAQAQWVEPATLIHNLPGQSGGDNFGFINRNLGDLDGDGINDIGVGVPTRDDLATNSGKVYIYSGATGALIRTHLGAGGINAGFGFEMSGVGDLNGDGLVEYVIGAPGTSNLNVLPAGTGRAFLYDGATGSLMHTWTSEAAGDGLGTVVAGAGHVLDNAVGDINNDGTPDVLLTASSFNANAGRAYAYSGGDYTLIHTVDGVSAGDFFGSSIGGLGDINADGHGDFIVGAPSAGAGNLGRAYVYSGATGLQLPFSPLVPDGTAVSFGNIFASGSGDIDLDGTPDIFVGDLNDTQNGAGAGKAYVFSGADGSRIHTWAGSQAGEGLGVGRTCGDADFDGTPDFIVSAYSSSAQANAAGRAFLFSGATGGILRTLTRTAAGQFFGWSTVGCGDLDGDGSLDFAISSLLNGAGPNAGRGRVYVIAGDIFPCFADCDGSGTLNVDDIDCFVAAFLGAEVSADCDANGVLNVDDIDCFVSAFLSGCP